MSCYEHDSKDVKECHNERYTQSCHKWVERLGEAVGPEVCELLDDDIEKPPEATTDLDNKLRRLRSLEEDCRSDSSDFTAEDEQQLRDYLKQVSTPSQASQTEQQRVVVTDNVSLEEVQLSGTATEPENDLSDGSCEDVFYSEDENEKPQQCIADFVSSAHDRKNQKLRRKTKRRTTKSFSNAKVYCARKLSNVTENACVSKVASSLGKKCERSKRTFSQIRNTERDTKSNVLRTRNLDSAYSKEKRKIYKNSSSFEKDEKTEINPGSSDVFISVDSHFLTTNVANSSLEPLLNSCSTSHATEHKSAFSENSIPVRKTMSGAASKLPINSNAQELSDKEVHRCDSVPVAPNEAKLLRRCRYLSVSSRRLSEPSPLLPSLPATNGFSTLLHPRETRENEPLSADCVEFYAKLSALIHCNGDDSSGLNNRKISHEEQLYQQELNETLWLEIQARHSQLDCSIFDELLFNERNKVMDVVEEVLKFRAPERPRGCPQGCLSVWCLHCIKHQDEVLRRVSLVIHKIDQIESLFPSSSKMSQLYPCCSEPSFVSRRNTLYLWQNTVLQLRQTIVLLGNRLQQITNTTDMKWPSFDILHPPSMSSCCSSCLSSTSTTISGNEKCVDSPDAGESLRVTSELGNELAIKLVISDEGTVLDSSSHDETFERRRSSSQRRIDMSNMLCPELFRTTKHSGLGDLKRSKSTMFLEENPYRQYVERCMHSKGLRKTFDKIGEVNGDVMARCVCLMEQHERSHAQCHKTFREVSSSRPDSGRQAKESKLYQQNRPQRPDEEAFRHRNALMKQVLDEHCADLQRQLLWLQSQRPTDRKFSYSGLSSSGAEQLSACADTASPRHFAEDVAPCSDISLQSWSGRMWLLGLPGLSTLFLFLATVPVQLICQCLSLRLSQRPKEPSALSIKQLMREYREGLRLAVTVRRRFEAWSAALTTHLNPKPLPFCEGSPSLGSAPLISNKYKLSPFSQNSSRNHSPRYSNNEEVSVPILSVSSECEATAVNYSGLEPSKQLLSVPKPLGLPSFSAPTSPMRHFNFQSSGSDAHIKELIVKESNVALISGVISDQDSLLSQSSWKANDYLPLPVESFGKKTEAMRAATDRGSKDTEPFVDEGVDVSSPKELRVNSSCAAASLALRDELSIRRTRLLQDLDRYIEEMLKVYLEDLEFLCFPVNCKDKSQCDCSLSSTNACCNCVSLPWSASSCHSLLLQEWQFVCSICPQVLGAYNLAAIQFSNLAAQVVKRADPTLGLEQLVVKLQTSSVAAHEADLVNHTKHAVDSSPRTHSPSVWKKKYEVTRSEVRDVEKLVSSSRQRMARALVLAKTLKDHLEIAVQFRLSTQENSASRTKYLFERHLHVSGHAKVLGLPAIDKDYEMYVPGYLSDNVEVISALLSLTPHDCDTTDGRPQTTNAAPSCSTNVVGGQVPTFLLTSPSTDTEFVIPPSPAPSFVVTGTKTSNDLGSNFSFRSASFPTAKRYVSGGFSVTQNSLYPSDGLDQLAYVIIVKIPRNRRYNTPVQTDKKCNECFANFAVDSGSVEQSDPVEKEKNALDCINRVVFCDELNILGKCNIKEMSALENDNNVGNKLGDLDLSDKEEAACEWTGRVVNVHATAAVTIALSSLLDCEVLVVTSRSSTSAVRRHLLNLIPSSVLQLVNDSIAPNVRVRRALKTLKRECLDVCVRLQQCVAQAQRLLFLEKDLDFHLPTSSSNAFCAAGLDRETSVTSPTATSDSTYKSARDATQKLFNFGFECHKDVVRLLANDYSSKVLLQQQLMNFAHAWMQFCKRYFPSGNGSRPRWATNGLDYILFVCNPTFLSQFSKQKAHAFQAEALSCYHHIVGVEKTSPSASSWASNLPGGANLQLRRTFRSTSSASGRNSTGSVANTPPTPSSAHGIPDSAPEFTVISNSSLCSQCDIYPPCQENDFHCSLNKEDCFSSPLTARRYWQRRIAFGDDAGCCHRIQDAVLQLEQKLQEQRRKDRRIGSVLEHTLQNSENSPYIRYKPIGFSWHRGFKIGVGRFGKVYTAVNNSTGELMAVKVQKLEPNDRKAVEELVFELGLLEGFEHPNLVKYYGMEVLENELLLFMEYCPEGTLETLSASTECGLPEEYVRRYTRQLLEGVAALHDRRVIHRDIKGANIFLTQDNHNLKLGDFGCAVRLRSDCDGTLKLEGMVGTHAYMAPEIFNSPDGYDRAVDIWSVACVIIEMSTGRRPWPEFNSGVQIMFSVGSGKSPAFPPFLSKEGREFLKLCFQHDPSKRASAFQLLHHSFVKVELDEECDSLPLFSVGNPSRR